MVEVKEAVKSAVAYFKDLIADATNIRLEEVELSDDERSWSVTLSAQIPGTEPETPAQIAAAFSDLFLKEEKSRIYKMFTISAESGSVKSMKIRKVA